MAGKGKWIGLGIVGILIIYSVSMYNGLVSAEEAVTASWSQVENVYQRRADLIPNLVETVKGYAAHEKEALTGVVEARAKATSTTIDANNLDANTIQKFQQAQDGLSSALSKLMVVVERYPDLKANQTFLQLQAQLEGTENRIAVERKRFIEKAQTYNTGRKKFPKVLFANMFGFDEKAYFNATEGADKAPEVKF